MKLKISHLFHWLYALLMLLPFILLFGSFISTIHSAPNLNDVSVCTYWFGEFFEIIDAYLYNFGSSGLIGETIEGVYIYLVQSVFGLEGQIAETIYVLLTYWTCVSIIWLIFDVLMYVPSFIHRWLDKGAIM